MKFGISAYKHTKFEIGDNPAKIVHIRKYEGITEQPVHKVCAIYSNDGEDVTKLSMVGYMLHFFIPKGLPFEILHRDVHLHNLQYDECYFIPSLYTGHFIGSDSSLHILLSVPTAHPHVKIEKSILVKLMSIGSADDVHSKTNMKAGFSMEKGVHTPTDVKTLGWTAVRRPNSIIKSKIYSEHTVEPYRLLHPHPVDIGLSHPLEFAENGKDHFAELKASMLELSNEVPRHPAKHNIVLGEPEWERETEDDFCIVENSKRASTLEFKGANLEKGACYMLFDL